MKLFFFLLILIAGAAGGGYWYYEKQKEADAVKYLTTEVSRGTLTQFVTATGTLNPVVNVQVGSQISGNIQKLYADFNSNVKAGQIVAQLDPATYQAAFNQAQGELANSKASLDLARTTAKRKKDLVMQNAAPQADLDAANAALAQAEAQVQVRTANMEKAKVDLDRCSIFSPIDGTVITRSVDVGQTVAASLSAPVLFVIANDLTKMQIDTNVAEADVGAVEEGQTVEFTVDAFPFLSFQGKVQQVRNSATVVQNVVTYNVIIEVDNKELKLRPSMTANVSIIVAKKEDTLKIPNAALRYRPPDPPADAESPTPASTAATAPTPGAGAGPGRGGMGQGGGGGGGGRRGQGDRPRSGSTRPSTGNRERTVQVLVDGAPSPRQIKVGITDGVATEVLDGLSEHDLVITGQTGGPSRSGAPAANPFGGGMPRRF